MIAAAYRVLARNPGAASLSEILTEAKLGTRSFYRHFESKDALLLAMFEAENDRVTRELQEKLAAAGTPSVALENWIRLYLALVFDPRRQRRTSVMRLPQITVIPGYAAVFVRAQERHRRTLVAALTEGTDTGVFECSDPVGDAVLIQDLVTSVIARCRDGIQPGTVDDAFAAIHGFVVRAVGARPRGT